MDPTRIGLFDLAEKRLVWTAQRQSVLAANIANANTPAYQARDVQSFAQRAGRSWVGRSRRRTQPGHMAGTVPSGLASLTDGSAEGARAGRQHGRAGSATDQGGGHRNHAGAGDDDLEEIHGDVQHGPWAGRVSHGKRSEPGAEHFRNRNGRADHASAGDRARTSPTRIRPDRPPAPIAYRRKTITFESAVDRAAGRRNGPGQEHRRRRQRSAAALRPGQSRLPTRRAT